MNDDSTGANPVKCRARPELGPADLLVECAQSFVHGWTEQRVRDYGESCAAMREREFRDVLQELRIRMHAAGRRPEECYEMSLIDDVLRA